MDAMDNRPGPTRNQVPALNRRITDTILASISRSTHRPSATQLLIDISMPEGGRTGLRQSSMIQCENLLTYDQPTGHQQDR